MIDKTFIIIISILIVQRIIELYISKRNEKWLLENGATEFGHSHYKYIVILHTLFIASLIINFFSVQNKYFFILPFILVLILQIFRFWVIFSLGNYWNTKILRIPNSPLIKKGLYKYLKHPNYIIVICEILLIPLIFGLYITSIIFTILNAVILYKRLKIENEALTS